MKIQNMFQKDINRDINGVIKVSQNDDKSLRQELEAANAALAQKEQELSALRERLNDSNRQLSRHGFCGLVIRMRQEGHTEAEIAAHLLKLRLSRFQVGLLLDREETPLSPQGFRRRCDRVRDCDTP